MPEQETENRKLKAVFVFLGISKTPLILYYTLSMLLMSLSGCSINQYHRDSLRYEATNRGTEKYSINNNDSLNAALIRSDKEMALYAKHRLAYNGTFLKKKFSDLLDQVKNDLPRIDKKLEPFSNACPGCEICKLEEKRKNSLDAYNKQLANLRGMITASVSEFNKGKSDNDVRRMLIVQINLQSVEMELSTLDRQVDDFLKDDEVNNFLICRAVAKDFQSILEAINNNENIKELLTLNEELQRKSCNLGKEPKKKINTFKKKFDHVSTIIEEAKNSFEKSALDKNIKLMQEAKSKLENAQLEISKLDTEINGLLEDTEVQTFMSCIKKKTSLERHAEVAGAPAIKERKMMLPEEKPISQTNNGFTENNPDHFSKSQIELIWPDQVLKNITNKTTTKKMEGDKVKEEINHSEVSNEVVRSLSSTASIAQMRDLLTEPSFPTMLPIERNVQLGCLPPPDSAAFDAVAKLATSFEQEGKVKASLSGDFSSSAIKLFEESERTMFLQYALFRLCEMSINAPSGFRNVYPVVIHDIVRRTAEMNQIAASEAEARRAEEEKTKQEKEKTEQEREKTNQKKVEEDSKKDAAYYDCIKGKLTGDKENDAKIVTTCKQAIFDKEVK